MYACVGRSPSRAGKELSFTVALPQVQRDGSSALQRQVGVLPSGYERDAARKAVTKGKRTPPQTGTALLENYESDAEAHREFNHLRTTPGGARRKEIEQCDLQKKSFGRGWKRIGGARTDNAVGQQLTLAPLIRCGQRRHGTGNSPSPPYSWRKNYGLK